MPQIEDFPEVSAEYWFDVENAVPFVNIVLMHVRGAEAVELAEAEETFFNPEVTFLQFGSVAFEGHEELRRWLAEPSVVPFVVHGPLLMRDFQRGNPLRVGVALKIFRPRGEATLWAAPRAGVAAGLEAALRNDREIWKVAATPQGAEAGAAVWILRLGSTPDLPLAFDVAGLSSTFAPVPVSRSSWSKADVPIHDYRPGGRIDFASPSRTMGFSAIDLDAWMLRLLHDLETVRRLEGDLARVHGAASRFAELLASRVWPVSQRQRATDPADARRQLALDLREDLTAWGADALIRFPIAAVTAGDERVMRLAGSVQPAPADVTLARTAFDVPGEPSLVLRASSNGPRTRGWSRQFAIDTLDLFRGRTFAFLVPDDPKLRIELDSAKVPFVSRSVPPAPALTAHEALRSFERPNTIDEAMAWTYRCRFRHDGSVHDLIVLDFDGDGPSIEAPAAEEKLFLALAQHVVTFDAIRADWPSPSATNALGEIAERVLAALEQTETQVTPPKAHQFALWIEDWHGIARIHATSSLPGSVPVVDLEGWARHATGIPGVYQYRDRHDISLSTDEVLPTLPFDVRIPGLSLFSRQSGAVTVRVIRNGALDPEASEQPFVRESAGASLAPLVPSFDAATPIAIGGARKPLAAHLQASLPRLLSNAAQPVQSFRLECRYAETGEMPVFRLERMAALESPNVADEPMVSAIASAVTQWMSRHPVSAAGKLIFDLSLLGDVPDAAKPLVRLRLELPLRDVER